MSLANIQNDSGRIRRSRRRWCLVAVSLTFASASLAAEKAKSAARTSDCATVLRADAAPLKLKESGRSCLIQENWDAAIGLFAKLLKQPDPAFHQEALELLGLARERASQGFRAKADYMKYLSLYPKGEGAERVRRRLVGLENATAKEKDKIKGRDPRAADSGWNTVGSFGQYYFRDELFTENQGEHLRQSLFLTTLDVNSRYRGERFEMRAQFSGRYRENFLPTIYHQNDQLRIASAYLDVVDKETGLSGRLGRQMRSSGGVMGRFDGAVLSYRFAPQWQATVVGGFPVRPYRSTAPDTDTSFVGGSVEFGPFDQVWAGNLFFINQSDHDKLARRAVGGELRYQDPTHPVFTLLDYDLYFGDLNTAQILANWNFDNGAVVSVTADYRKTPYLSTSNALIGWGSGNGPGSGVAADSIRDILFQQPSIDLKAVAANNSATLKNLSLSGNYPLVKNLQLIGEISITHLSATKGSPWVSAYQGTGTQVSWMGQMVASHWLGKGDVWNIGARYTQQTFNDILSLFVDGRYPLSADLRLDPRLRFDLFSSFKGEEVWRIRPGMRFNYRVYGKIYAELEGGLEFSNQPALARETDTKGYYFSAGYRWDF